MPTAESNLPIGTEAQGAAQVSAADYRWFNNSGQELARLRVADGWLIVESLLIRDTGDPAELVQLYRNSNGNARVSLFNGDGVELVLEAGDGYIDFVDTSIVVNSGQPVNQAARFTGAPLQTTPILTVESSDADVFLAVKSDGTLSVANLLQLGALTVAALPDAEAFEGSIAYVNNATDSTRLNKVENGGALRLLVFSDGHSWLIL